MNKKIVLGDEYDERLRRALIDLLKRLGAELVDTDWAVAGSQEIEKVTVILDGNSIDIESETYIGLSISGDEQQVSDIARRLRQ